MSLRQVLTIYNAERQLSDDETALLNTLRRMSDSDRQMFIDGLAGKSSQKKSSKTDGEKRNIQKCDIDGCGLTKRAAIHKDAILRGFHAFLAPVEKSAGGGGHTRRASGLSDEARRRLRRQVNTDDDNKCSECGKIVDDNVHHIRTFLDYHPFVSTAQAAELSSNQATSETGKGGAGDAHHAASSGD